MDRLKSWIDNTSTAGTILNAIFYLLLFFFPFIFFFFCLPLFFCLLGLKKAFYMIACSLLVQDISYTFFFYFSHCPRNCNIPLQLIQIYFQITLAHFICSVILYNNQIILVVVSSPCIIIHKFIYDLYINHLYVVYI